MLAIVLAVSASLSWGLSDFAAGLVSRRLAAWTVVFWSQIVGIPPLLLLITLVGSPVPPVTDVLWGALAGCLSGLGLSMLYWAMAMDMITVVAPVAALAPVIPVIVGVKRGDNFSTIHWVGVSAALIGVLLLSIQTNKGHIRAIPRWSLGLAALAALAFGCWFVFMQNATGNGYLWALVTQRTASAALLGIVISAIRVDPRPRSKLVPALVAVGLLDLAGTAAFSVASHTGALGVVSVLSSLYPLPSVVLALMILKERLNLFQSTGVAFALAAIGCLAS